MHCSILAVDEADLFEALEDSSHERRRGRRGAEKANDRDLWLRAVRGNASAPRRIEMEVRRRICTCLVQRHTFCDR